MGWQQRQIVATAVMAAALIAIYVAVQRGIPWPLIARIIGDAQWFSW